MIFIFPQEPSHTSNGLILFLGKQFPSTHDAAFKKLSNSLAIRAVVESTNKMIFIFPQEPSHTSNGLILFLGKQFPSTHDAA
ncbi:CLUMA_CG007767, isoform A [Clunio marinus]|uniref:CLUMA_CG007767, isoform A n=1 Tax=Clunio marinus TaxID=568069 RepID=A0A1J1I3S9_9DIPT|nr:CLUMA_CG007767, isoform A [Clunio marinus]